MKRLFLFIAFVGAMLGAYADKEEYHPKETDDYITINDVTVVPGSADTYKVQISLVGTKIYTAYEMDLDLPSGLEPVLDKDGTPKVSLWKGSNTIYPYTEDEDSGNKDFTHILAKSYGAVGPNVIRMSCISLSAQELTATKGILVTITLKATPYLKPGDVQIKVTNLHFITNEEIWVKGEQYNGQQYNCKDQTLTVHVKGESRATVAVSAKNKYSTCVLPFDVDELPAGLQAYTVTERSTDNRYAYLKEAKTMRAFTPYILYAENGFTGEFGGTVDENLYQEQVVEGILHGTLVPCSVDDGFILQNQGEGVKLYAMQGKEFLIPAGKCWVLPKINNGTEVKSIDMRLDDATGVESAVQEYEPDAFYSLEGKRVCHPQRGHIYIMSGKKVLMLK